MTTLPRPLEDAVRASADPDAVRLVFERIAEERPDDAEQIDAPTARDVAAVAGASRSLARLLVADPEALAVLANGPEAPAVTDLLDAVGRADSAEAIARRQHLALLRVATDDLAGRSSLEEVGGRLSGLADAVLGACLAVAAPEVPLAVIGMGKHGAQELNYASDVDVVFVTANDADPTEATAAARRVLAVAGAAYRIDTDLRPEGRNGALVRTLESYEAYWEKWARPWEFQAIMKARPSAGDAALGSAFADRASAAVWSRHLDAEALSELRAMKSRAEGIVAARGLSERELKRGRGGIRDIEFAAQLLQLVHGGSDPALRVRSTLAALSELGSAGYVDGTDAAALALAYCLLRTVEHRLQLVEEAQVHTLPPPGVARDHLAAVLGFEVVPTTGTSSRRRSDRMDAVLARYQSSVRSIHERLFFRPLLEVFGAGSTTDRARLSETAVAERLSAFGFREADRTRQALAELTRGLTRSSRLMQQLLPVLLGWLSETPDPDLGLLALRNLAGMPHQRDVLVASFRDSPELARRLCTVLGTSRRIGELALRHPALALQLGDDRELAPPSSRDLVEAAVVAADGTPEAAVRGLRRIVGQGTLRIAAADLLLGELGSLGGVVDPVPVARQLATLGDAALTAALHASSPPLAFGIVAMGRLGGSELSYGSDLDVILVHDGRTSADAAAAEQVASTLFRILNGSTPSERIWTTDASLRPEGRKGPLARSLDAYVEYHARWGSAWERQALIRARPVAGDPDLLDRFMALVDETVWHRPLTADDVREIRRLKARTERERIPSGEDPQFHFKLGKGSLADIEWTTQLLQLQHGVRGQNTRESLRALAEHGVMEEREVSILLSALTYLERTRSRWHLVGNYVAGAGGPVTHSGSDSLPHAPEALARLARALGETPAELREQYRRLTRRARHVVERRFYEL